MAQLEISAEFGYLKDNQLDEIEEKAERMNRMLWKLSKSLETVFSVDGGPLTDNVVLNSVQRVLPATSGSLFLSVQRFSPAYGDQRFFTSGSYQRSAGSCF